MISRPKGNAPRQHGAVSVEFTLLAIFLLIPLTAGVIDFGMIFQTHNILVRAAEQGAMAASRSLVPDIIVTQALTNGGLDTARSNTVVTPSYQSLPLGTPITVTITYDITGLPLIPWPSFSSSFSTVQATVTARHL